MGSEVSRLGAARIATWLLPLASCLASSCVDFELLNQNLCARQDPNRPQWCTEGSDGGQPGSDGGFPAATTAYFQHKQKPDAQYAGLSYVTLRESGGADSDLHLGGAAGDRRLALVKWDLNSLPTDAAVVQVRLHLTRLGYSGVPFELYPLLRGWSGQSTWSAATASSQWEQPGAMGASDRGPLLQGNNVPGTGGELVALALNDATRCQVEKWVRQPGLNHGFLLQQSQLNVNTTSFHTGTANQEWHRGPMLEVVYVPGQPASCP